MICKLKFRSVLLSCVAFFGAHSMALSQERPAVISQAVTTAKVTPTSALEADALDISGRLNLPYLIQQAQKNHPVVQAARLDVQASDADLQASQRQRWPTFSANLENRSSQVSAAYTQILRLQQTLWDAGRVNARIEEAQAMVEANTQRVSMAAIQIGIQVVNAWQQLQVADARLSVASATLAKLTDYKLQMQRRVDAQVSPIIDLELVSSRLSQAQVEQVQATNNRQVALHRLEQYTGLRGLAQLPHRFEASHEDLSLLDAPTIDWQHTAQSHPSVLKAQQDMQAALLRLKAKQAEQFPQVYVRVDRPLNAANNSTNAFIGLSYTPGAGLATGLEAQALSSRSASLEQAVEAAKREVEEVLNTDRNELESAKQRIKVLRTAVLGAQLVDASYNRQFAAGRKSWLDLMNASRELTQSQYALADSHVDVISVWHRLQLRTTPSAPALLGHLNAQ